MKRILFIIIALVAFVAIQAQTVTFPALDPEKTFVSVTTPYTLTAATVRNFIFPAAQHYKVCQDYVIKLDTIVGTNHTTIAVALFGQKSPVKGDWTAIGSAVTWTVSTTAASKDTTIIISNTTATRYRNYKVTVTGVGTGAVSRISAQELKLYRE